MTEYNTCEIGIDEVGYRLSSIPYGWTLHSLVPIMSEIYTPSGGGSGSTYQGHGGGGGGGAGTADPTCCWPVGEVWKAKRFLMITQKKDYYVHGI